MLFSPKKFCQHMAIIFLFRDGKLHYIYSRSIDYPVHGIINRHGLATFHDSRRRPRPARIPRRATFLAIAGPRRWRQAHDPAKRTPARRPGQVMDSWLSLSVELSGDRLSTLEWRNAAAPHHPAHRRRALLRIDYK